MAGTVGREGAGGGHRVGARLVGQSFAREPGEVARALQQLPGDVIRADHGLRLVAAEVGQLAADDAWVLALPSLREARSGALSDADATLCLLLAARLHLAEGHFPQVRGLLDEVEPRLRRLAAAGSEHLALATFVHARAGAAALSAGDLVRARDLMSRARAVAARTAAGWPEATYGATARHLAADLALVSAVSGDLRVADELLEVVLGAVARGIAPTRRVTDATQLTQLVLLLDRGLQPQAGRVVRVRPPASYGELWPLALWAHTQFLLLAGRYHQGLRLIEQAEDVFAVDIATGDGVAGAVAAAARAQLLVALGDLRGGWAAADAAYAGPAALPSARAAVLYASGEFEAAGFLARAARVSRPTTRREELILHGVEAAVARARGDLELAGSTLARVRSAADEQRWRSLPAHLPPSVRDEVATDAEEGTGPGGAVPTRAWSAWMPPPVLSAPLSPREQVVLRLVVAGTPRAEVAARLGVSLNTVKTQVRRLYAKLGVRDRAGAVTRVMHLPPGSQLWHSDDAPG